MNTYRILTGDVMEQLRTLPAGSIHTCVTSPPYWGLRDYGVPGQIGLEPTPQEYVSRLVEVFEEVRRVLRHDGTLWLNLGDSYANDGKWGGATGGKHVSALHGKPVGRTKRFTGLKPKDLVGIPWRVALALQDAGWWLRAEIIWAKSAPMPESVTDRPTRSHEQIFLLTKAARYFYDAEAVKEASTGQTGAAADFARETKDHLLPNQTAIQHRMNRKPTADTGTRNQRDVWLLGPEPYPEAHFATFPTEIPRRSIRAGTSERGCCPACGAPWKRVVEKTGETLRERAKRNGTSDYAASAYSTPQGMPKGGHGSNEHRITTTTGWLPSCACDAGEPVPCTVLDPFLGSGTTVAVAIEQGRNGIGIDLNPDYVDLARRRINSIAPLLAQEKP